MKKGAHALNQKSYKQFFDREDIHYFVGEIDQQIVGIVAYMEPSHLMHFFY